MGQAAGQSIHGIETDPLMLARANAMLRREIAKRQRVEKLLIERNKQLRDDLRMAAQFQRAILPVPPVLPHLSTAIRYWPFREVSGDIYHLHLNREGELGVLLGDATGHGLSAAFMTMLLQSALDGLRRDLPPHQMLARLNAQLCVHPTGCAVTAAYFRVGRDGTLAVSHAGHPSILVLPAQGPIRGFAEGGCALGQFAEEPVPYVTETCRLAPGDTVVAYTDGVPEARDRAGGSFGPQRIVQTLEANRGTDPETLLDRLLGEVQRHARGGRGDDLTLLACRYGDMGVAPPAA
ncbi:MAG: PP2C family protein-serine/threonine phosphatase [Gammaproteobacteria bacterium]